MNTFIVSNRVRINPLVMLMFLFIATGLQAEEPEGLVSETQHLTETHTRSGFLGNYDNFKVINTETLAEVWIKPPHEDFSLLKKYDAIVFSPIEVWMDPASAHQGINPSELKVITDHFMASLHEQLGEDYSIVEKAGPNVMNLRIAITGIEKEKPDYLKPWNLIPVKLVWEISSAGYRKAAGKSLDVYEAQAEFEIRDSVTGERLVAAIDKQGSKSTTKKADDDNWSLIEKSLDKWAKIIKDRLTLARNS